MPGISQEPTNHLHFHPRFISPIESLSRPADAPQLSRARRSPGLRVLGLRTSTQVTVVDRRTGARATRPADRWDVRGKADGIQFSKRFERAGLAQVWKEQLDRGFANGLPFDLRSRRFVASDSPTDPRPALPGTVFAITEAFYWLLGEPGLGAEDQDPGSSRVQPGSEVAPGLRCHPRRLRPRCRCGLPGPRQLPARAHTVRADRPAAERTSLAGGQLGRRRRRDDDRPRVVPLALRAQSAGPDQEGRSCDTRLLHPAAAGMLGVGGFARRHRRDRQPSHRRHRPRAQHPPDIRPGPSLRPIGELGRDRRVLRPGDGHVRPPPERGGRLGLGGRRATSRGGHGLARRSSEPTPSRSKPLHGRLTRSTKPARIDLRFWSDRCHNEAAADRRTQPHADRRVGRQRGPWTRRNCRRSRPRPASRKRCAQHLAGRGCPGLSCLYVPG